MLVYVNHIYGPVISKMARNGWRIHKERGLEGNERRRSSRRRISGLQMEKDFKSIGEAIRDFESITGYDVISNKDEDGCSIFAFYCDEKNIAVSGWECGKYMFHRWVSSPRKAIEALNEMTVSE